MEKGGLVKINRVHEDQDQCHFGIVVDSEVAWESDPHDDVLTITILNVESGVHEQWFDWQLELISEK